jgi:NADPH:quinone reductase
MRAAICEELGPPEVVRVGEIDSPTVGSGQVRIRVEAAAVNYPDVLVVAGEYQIKVPPPFVPGSELAGVILESADDVARFQPGDRVFGSTIVGAFAEEAVLNVGALTAVPVGVDSDVAAAFGVAHSTAYHVLRSVAEIQPDERLIVLGAGGGVGLAAVQLGAVLGASVTAIASTPEKLAVAARYGATTLIDHRSGDLRQLLKAALPEGADVVIDPVGGDLAEPALRRLRYGGRFVTVGYASGVIPRIPLNLVLLKGIQILGFQFIDFATQNPDDRARNDQELLELLAAGKTFPHVGARFPLNDSAEALRYVADGRAIGKVLIEVDGS